MWKEKNSFISNLLQTSFSKQMGDRTFKSILFRKIAPWKYFLKDLFKSRVPRPAALQIPPELLEGLKYNTIPSTCSLVFKLFQGYKGKNASGIVVSPKQEDCLSILLI